MPSASVTRGHGLLEGFLARKRCDMANTLIGTGREAGSILDIGCGSYPLFLEQVNMRRKVGVDQVVDPARQAHFASRGIELVARDLDRDPRLPFDDASFDIVTMLAVFEHVEADKLPLVIREIHRVLKPGGIYVVTTPASWADPILTTMSWLRLVSADEVDEHEETHTLASMKDAIAGGGFRSEHIETGTFECGMNLWARAKKANHHKAAAYAKKERSHVKKVLSS